MSDHDISAKRYVRLDLEEAVKAGLKVSSETKRGFPVGAIAAYLDGNDIKVGWSVCNNVDLFSYAAANIFLNEKLRWYPGQKVAGKCQYKFPVSNLQGEIDGPTGQFGNSIKFLRLDDTYRKVLRDIDYRMKLASGEIVKKVRTSTQATS